MISKARKFPARQEFLSFRKTAKQLTTPHVRLLYSAAASTHLSVIVPKKCNKRAVVRNWLKRLTYDTLWLQTQDKKLDCVVVYKPLPLKKSPENKKLIMSELTSLHV